MQQTKSWRRKWKRDEGKVCFINHNYGLDSECDDGFMKLRQVASQFYKPCSFSSLDLSAFTAFFAAHKGLEGYRNPLTETHMHWSPTLLRLFLCRTLTSKTSHPVGVMGWRSALWCTPSSPLSLTTTLCRQSTANTTLSWPLEQQSEWYQYINIRIWRRCSFVEVFLCVPDMMKSMQFN